MNPKRLSIPLLLLCFIISAPKTNGANLVKPELHRGAQLASSLNLDKDKTETNTRKKLNFKEKVLLKVAKRKRKPSPGRKPQQELKTDEMAMVGAIAGLLGLVLTPILLSAAVRIFLGILAILFSVAGFANIKKEPEKRKGKGLAFLGLLFGLIGVVGGLLILSFAAGA
jgi:hypothetical protein